MPRSVTRDSSLLEGRIRQLEDELASLRRALALESSERRRLDALLEAVTTPDETAGSLTADPLTGLPNSRGLDSRLAIFLENLQVRGEPFAMIHLEIDDFQAVHDWLGDEAANEVLREVGRRLTTCVRGGDVVARTGRNDFVLLLARTGEEQARHVASRIICESAYPVAAGGTVSTVSLSLGVTTGAPGDSSAKLLGRAARALDEARSGAPASYVLALP